MSGEATTTASREKTPSNPEPEILQGKALEKLAGTIGGKLDALNQSDDPEFDEELDALDDDEEDVETGEDETEDDEESDEPSDEDDDADDPDESEDDEDDDDEEAAKPAAKDRKSKTKGGPTLPDAHRRSLKAYGWTDDEIDADLDGLGDKFIETAARMHNNRNKEVAQWAAQGRAARDQQTPQDTPQAGNSPTQQQAPQPTQKGLQTLDVAKLKEQYGNDELIDALVGPLNSTVEQINSILPKVEAQQKAARQSEIDSVMRKVDGFFGDKSMADYAKLYGTNGQALSPKQVEKRDRVLDEADALVLGARLQGRDLGLEEALTFAHELVSKDFQNSKVRKTIHKEAKKRNRSITNRPSSRQGKRASGKQNGELTERHLEAKVSKGLKNVFG